jgi:amino acid adenylation domain-containing protein
MGTGFSDAKRKLLEKYLRGDLGIGREVSAIPRRKPDEPIPLSSAQEQVWVHAQLAPHVPLYNEPVTIQYSGIFNPQALEQAFNEILRRHEAWRTSFPVVDGRPVQKVHESLSISLPVVDLRGLPPAERNSAALQIATADARKGIDLASVPLFRAKLVRLGSEDHRLYLTLCHIIFDGVALYRVFLPELSALYKAFAAGQSSPLPELAIQYPDFACWERSTVTDKTLSGDIDYWSDRLRAPLPDVYLPGDHRLPRARSFRGAMYPFRLRTPLMKKVRDFCRSEGASVFHVLFAAFAGLLQRYSSEDRIPVGMVTAGRSHPETNGLLGYFLNTVVVPADASGNPRFRELVARARDWSIEAIDHGKVPFEQLVRALKVQREPSRNPLFQALFSLDPPLPPLDSNWGLTQTDVDTGTTKYDLYLETDDRGDKVLAHFHYSTDLFERQSIARMALHWKALLASGIANPDLRLSELHLLSIHERRTALRNSRGPDRQIPPACVHEIFEQQAERTPEAIAVISGGQDISYRELNERANQLAHLLLRRGVQKETLVGLAVERTLPMVIALIGILKAGAAYVPLDSRLPDERLRYLLADSKPAVIITDRLSYRPEFGRDVFVLDESFEGLREESTSNPRTGVAPNNLAYIMYTSGSTGQPKGVAVEHRSVTNLLRSMQREPGLSPSDILLAVTTISFDIAGLEIFLPLITGARVVLAGSADVVDGTRLKQLLQASNATVMQATPATWRLLIEAEWGGSQGLKVLCGGESLPPELARDLLPRCASVWNVYGPTETTIWSSIYRVRGDEEDAIPIGHPIDNTAIYILDGRGSPVPCNVSGEIYIGGEGLARGYLNRAELTAERFVTRFPAPEQSTRLYRTGDIGRRRAHGEIEYLGRADTQIKLRGMRIELGEVESVLSTHPTVQQVVVTVTGASEQQKLSAYVLAKAANGMLSAEELRRYARSKLPEQMTPTEYWKLDEMPLLPSGKINRAVLPKHATMLLWNEQGCVGPRNETEAQLEKIWSELLNLEKIGVDQNFFELGGHSLLVLQMTARIRRKLNVELPARVVFEFPTIAALAEQVVSAGTPALTARSSPMRHRAADRDALLSQLDRLPAEDAQALLKSMLDQKRAELRRVSQLE